MSGEERALIGPLFSPEGRRARPRGGQRRVPDGMFQLRRVGCRIAARHDKTGLFLAVFLNRAADRLWLKSSNNTAWCKGG